MTKTLYRLGRAGATDTDAVHVHDPELLLVLLVLSLRRRRPALVYDAHEDYAAQLREKPYVPKPLRPVLAYLLGRAEQFVAQRCDLVVAATPSISRRFGSCNVVVVQNMPRHEAFPAARTRGDRDQFEVMHVGEMNPRRGGEALRVASQQLSGDGFAFQQVGPVKPAELLAELSGSVNLVDRIEHEALLRQLADADAGLLLYHPGPNHDESQPNKLFEYLILGLPLLVSEIAHWRAIVERCDALVEFVDPTDSNDVMAGLRRLRGRAVGHDRIGQARRARDLFSWSREAQVLVAAYSLLESAAATSS